MNIHEIYDFKWIQTAPTKYKLLYFAYLLIPMGLSMYLVTTYVIGGAIGAGLAAGLAYAVGIPIIKKFIKPPKVNST